MPELCQNRIRKLITQLIEVMDRSICNHSIDHQSLEPMEKREIGNKESACFVAANFCVTLQKAPASRTGSLIVKIDCHLCENIRNELKQSPQEETRTRDLCRDRDLCQPYRRILSALPVIHPGWCAPKMWEASHVCLRKLILLSYAFVSASYWIDLARVLHADDRQTRQ